RSEPAPRPSRRAPTQRRRTGTSMVFDTGALIAFDRRVAALVEAVRRRRELIVTPSGCVAQAWREGPRQTLLARLLSGIHERALPPTVCRHVGGLCSLVGPRTLWTHTSCRWPTMATLPSPVTQTTYGNSSRARGHVRRSSVAEVLPRATSRLRGASSLPRRGYFTNRSRPSGARSDVRQAARHVATRGGFASNRLRCAQRTTPGVSSRGPSAAHPTPASRAGPGSGRVRPVWRAPRRLPRLGQGRRLPRTVSSVSMIVGLVDVCMIAVCGATGPESGPLPP